MNKKKIIIIVLAVILAVAAVATVYGIFFSKPKKIMPKETVKLSPVRSTVLTALSLIFTQALSLSPA